MRNRGKEAKDDLYFGEKYASRLLQAGQDVNTLLSKGYPIGATTTFVGNHFRLNKRQIQVLSRICDTEENRNEIMRRAVSPSEIAGQKIFIDTFNLLILVEGMLSGAYIFKCYDGVLRDLSGVHGSYKTVSKTTDAIHLIGSTLQKLGASEITWVIDRPVSNSGKLNQEILNLTEERKKDFPKSQFEIQEDADSFLIAQQGITLSGDKWIINQVPWFNLPAYLMEEGTSPLSFFSFQSNLENT